MLLLAVIISAALILIPPFAISDSGDSIEVIDILNDGNISAPTPKTDKCQVCQDEVDDFIQVVRSGAPRSVLERYLVDLCVKYSGMGMEGCVGLMGIEMNTILYIVNNRPNLTGVHVCAIYKQDLGCVDPNQGDWSIDIPDKESNNYRVENDVELPTKLKVLHLTDIHFDPLYTPGSNAKCDLPLCCQNDSGKPLTPKEAAGYWGDYRVCDIPWHSVLNLMDQITKQHKQIDYIYYTGDIISHIGWKTTREGNTAAIKQLFELLSKTFKSVPIYAVLGNHEAHPCDFYAPNSTNNEVSTQWVYEVVDTEWSRWLPKSTSNTVRKGGYYTVLVKPGFRIIGLNSNVCYTANLWLIYDDNDPFDQLKWLVQVLLKAEKNGEYVHILSHIPPGSKECHKIWNREYIKIVKRFSKTIQAQFNGHTHQDELRIFYEDDNHNKVSNVAYNGASFTTFVGFNPNYRIYDVNSMTYEVTNYDEWIFNLTEANLHPDTPPRWYKLYSFVEDYNLGKLTKDSLGSLVKRMANNETLLRQYYRYFVRESDAAAVCDIKCLNNLLCTITTLEIDDVLKC